jgi:adenine-specific DNA-methyltransferase
MSDGGSEQSYSGRLELTWTNKDQRLLAHEDGSYEWLPPSDYRVAEVRLLDNAGTVGETRADRSRAKDNLLIRGDALHALTSLSELPEFVKELVGKVKLAYLDPPFNTQQSFLHYDDALEHSVWLTMMRDRLLRIKRLLSPEGSVWVHCDDYEQARLKVMMDEIFGPDRFVATIVWQKRYSRENRAAIGSVHDYLVVFAPAGADWRDYRNRLPRDDKTSKQYRNPNNDPNGPWRVIPLTAQGFRKNQMYTITAPNGKEHRPPKGRCWGMVEERFAELLEEGRIYFGKDGNSAPGTIRYLSEAEGLVPWSWWPSDEVGHTDESKKEMLALFPGAEPFATPKPERLMRRIIAIGSSPGDTVLDCFLGSGTTAAVAHKMGRRWVGIEWSSENLDTFVIPRLSKVVNGDDPGGITEEEGWFGGGGLRILDVAPSMFHADGGVVVLADWATNGMLAEATAAQLGFEFESDPPFTGRKGRTRLAVIDGLISIDVAELIAGSLGDDERAVVCGTAVDPAASKVLREARAGSSVRKIPASILDEYRQARWTPRAIAEATSSVNGSAPSVSGRNVPVQAEASKS